MKVALCISGQPRSVESGWKTLKFIFENNNPDVFIHTWWDDNYLVEGVTATSFIGMNETETNIHKDTLRVVEDLYNPISMVVDSPKDNFDDCDNEMRRDRIVSSGMLKGSSTFLYNTASQWWTLKQSINLKKEYEVDNGFLYDVVIKVRFDLWIDKFIDFSKVENRINKKTIYVPSRKDYLLTLKNDVEDYRKYYDLRSWEQFQKWASYRTPDPCYFGDSNSLDVCGDLYDNVDMILKETPDFPFLPEMLLRKHLENNKININTMVNIDTDLWRARR